MRRAHELFALMRLHAEGLDDAVTGERFGAQM